MMLHPGLAKFDAAYGGFSNAVFPRECRPALSILESATNGHDALRRENSSGVAHACVAMRFDDAEGMRNIGGSRNDFKVLLRVVGLHAVDVIDSHAVIDGSVEGPGYKPVHLVCFADSVAAQSKSQVPIGVSGRPENPSGPAVSNAALAGDGVALVVLDGNPSFGGHSK